MSFMKGGNRINVNERKFILTVNIFFLSSSFKTVHELILFDMSSKEYFTAQICACKGNIWKVVDACNNVAALALHFCLCMH